MEVDDIISYHDLVTKEKAALQKGMTFGIGKKCYEHRPPHKFGIYLVEKSFDKVTSNRDLILSGPLFEA